MAFSRHTMTILPFLFTVAFSQSATILDSIGDSDFQTALQSKVKKVSFDPCPENPPLHCASDMMHCPGGMDSNGCERPGTCMLMTHGYDGNQCHVCPVTCQPHEVQCPGRGHDENGCELPGTCMPMTHGYDGEQCQCPVTCGSNETICHGGGTDSNGCDMHGTCMPKTYGSDGNQCHVCPVTCQPHEVQCPGGGHDENGCELPGTCMPMTYGSDGSQCQCPVTCGSNETICHGSGKASNGCDMPGTCMPKTYGSDGNQCHVCPVTCPPHEVQCPGRGYDENGCELPGTCMPMTYGSDGRQCHVVCPITCQPDEMLCDGGVDAFGCERFKTCRKMKAFFGFNNYPCPGACPLHCNPEFEVPCFPYGLDSNGCMLPGTCEAYGSLGILGSWGNCQIRDPNNHWAMTVTSNQCDGPVICQPHEMHCPSRGYDQNGCEIPGACVNKTYGSDGEECALSSAQCGTRCPNNQIACLLEGFDELGCQKPRQCMSGDECQRRVMELRHAS